MHESHSHSYDRSRLQVVLAVTSLYLLAEFAGGLITGSLALLTDAVHLLTDIVSICMSLFAMWIASRPASAAKTYGYVRAEILGALINGLFLWLLVILIFVEAFQRSQRQKAGRMSPEIGGDEAELRPVTGVDG